MCYMVDEFKNPKSTSFRAKSRLQRSPRKHSGRGQAFHPVAVTYGGATGSFDFATLRMTRFNASTL